jgi:carboxylesterase
MIKDYQIHPKANSFFFKKGEIGALLIHGLTGSPFEMRELADFLVARNITVICPRLAGHGTHPFDLEKRKVTEWLDDIKRAYDTLREYTQKIFLVGNSMGGNLAFEIARQLPVAGLVCLSTPVFIRGHFFIERLLPYLGPIIRFYKKKKGSNFKTRENIIEINCSYDCIPLKALGELLSLIKEQKKHSFSSLKAPCLIIHSTQDNVVHPKSADFIFEKLQTKKRLFLVSDPVHSLFFSESRSKIFEEIYRFIVENS